MSGGPRVRSRLRPEQVKSAEADHFRDASRLPVLDALHATGLGVEPQEPRNFSRAAEAVNEDRVGVLGVHDPITRHV